MTKKRTTPRATKGKPISGDDTIQAMLSAAPEPEPLPLLFSGWLKNISGGTLVIRPETTPSGNGYRFSDGGIKEITDPEDYQHLKDLQFDAGAGCCGAQPHAQTHYFSEV